MRLVVLGGSGSSTPELADTLAAWPGGLERRPPLDVALVGRSAAKLEVVAAEFRKRVGATGPPMTVAAEIDRRRALQGADVVLNQVRVGGLDARVFDETFPQTYGLPGEETMGPGGFANALRTVPALTPIWDDVATVAPGALVVNLTNPAGIVQQAACAGWPDLQVVAVCDGPAAFCALVATRLGRPVERVLQRYVGMNHCGWYIPESDDELPNLADLAQGMDPAIVDLDRALPAPYVRYYVQPERQLARQRGHPSRAEEIKKIDAALLAAYAAGHGGELEKRGAVWYRLVVVPLLDGWLHGTAEPLVLGVPNAGRLPEAPSTAMIEFAHRLAPGRLVPLESPAPPALPSLLLAQHGTYEALVVEALRPGAPPAARLRALMANPLVADLDVAVAMLAEIDARSPRG
jgi:6-phospho-beta-glucosidase